MPEDTPEPVEAPNPTDSTQDLPGAKPWAGRGGWVWEIGSYFSDDIQNVIARAVCRTGLVFVQRIKS